MNTKDINITDYNYDLPDERIAKYPLKERDSSKLLIYRNGEITQKHFYDISDELPEDSVLVRNNTKVIRARLIFSKPTGAKVEVFCLDPVSPSSYELALSSKRCCHWHCMLGNAKRWRVGSDALERKIDIAGHELSLFAKRCDNNIVEFYWDNEEFTFSEILDALGILPIPPYLNRETEERDLETYQTVYAMHKGSVAAPTAGLHFTDKVIEKIKGKGIDILDITLHVGAGTFKPVKTEKIGDHDMHSELIVVEKDFLRELMSKATRKIIAVGTTTVRTLESLYQLAVSIEQQNPDKISITQWQSYENKKEAIGKEEAIKRILEFMDKNEMDKLIFPTEIMIAPGYAFGMVDGMITNFHQPSSTLLLLVSAFTKGRWREIYDFALQNEFRFLSYGDSSILIP